MGGMDASEIGTATGTSVETIRRLVDAGVLREGPEGYTPGDVARVRLILALEASGVSLMSMGEAIRAGKLSLDFVDVLLPDPIPLVARTHSEVIAELEVPSELAGRIRGVLGTASAS